MSEFTRYITEYSEYLDEIRKRLYRLVIFFISTFAVGFLLTTPFLRFCLKILKIENVVITTTSPFQIVDLAMNIGLFFAVIATLPLFIHQTYSFLRPALTRKEAKFFFVLLPLGLILFITGFIYGFITLYFALELIAQINVNIGVINLWDITQFISQMVLTSALLGIIFQFPIVVTFLIKLEVFNTDFLKSKRRHAIVAIFIFVSLLPPTDGLSLVIMSVPLVLIYELTILFNSYRKLKFTT